MKLILAKIVAVMLAAGVRCDAKLTIRVMDLAAVPEKIMTTAVAVASRAMEQAGVEAAWTRCPGRPECGAGLGVGEFRLLILEMRPSGRRGDRMGFAIILPPGNAAEQYAGVFYAMVEDAARNLEVDPGVLLGIGIAHEIGHLLLGSAKHSRVGIMAPRFGREEVRLAARGELRFTADEAARIRAKVNWRLVTGDQHRHWME